MRAPRALFAALAFASLGGCRACDRVTSGSIPTLVASAAPESLVVDGRAAIAKHECVRCHDGIAGTTPAPTNKHCTHCHADILSGALKASPVDREKWSKVVVGLEEAPSLTEIGARYRRDWIAAYLKKPLHLRPRLALYMPRLDISDEEARAIAAALAPKEESDDAKALAGADLARGKALFESKACATCHELSGADVARAGHELPVAVPPSDLARGVKLAPDLRVTRERMSKSRTLKWLLAPKSVKPDTVMPDYRLTESEAKDLAAFILEAPLASLEKKAFVRLPPLQRPVYFAEVDQRVLHKTCWHCHSDPDMAIGDGGPGNSGGLGFRGRGLDLAAYAGVRAGILDKKGEERTSIVRGYAPVLAQALVARHREEEGGATGEVRGMPLGYAPLSAEEIQLVDTWIAQGAPR